MLAVISWHQCLWAFYFLPSPQCHLLESSLTSCCSSRCVTYENTVFTYWLQSQSNLSVYQITWSNYFLWKNYSMGIEFVWSGWRGLGYENMLWHCIFFFMSGHNEAHFLHNVNHSATWLFVGILSSRIAHHNTGLNPTFHFLPLISNHYKGPWYMLDIRSSRATQS